MTTRLVVGCGSVGHDLVDDLADEPGELRVFEPEPNRVEALRNEKIVAEQADVTDPAAIGGVDGVDVVVVAGDDPAQNLAATAAARSAYPGAYVLAYCGEDATRAQCADLAARVDRVLDPGAALVAHVDDALSSATHERVQGLRSVVTSVEGTLGVFCHDNPDPDAIASAVALQRVAASLGVDAEVCYFGEISHQENRAFVNLLEFDLRQLDAGDAVDYGAVALVDHSRPGVNDGLDPSTDVAVVIDHHPTDDPIPGRFVDVRDDAGATSTLLAEYVEQMNVDVDTALATGLLYGIRVDTKDFTREITRADFEATAFLLPYADGDVLERIESPSMSGDTLETIARAIRRRETRGGTLTSGVGNIADRDTLAQAADLLLFQTGVQTTVVYGYREGTLLVSARSTDPGVDLGDALRRAFGDIGSAGGHADMAGAQIPMGLFADVGVEAEESLTSVLAEQVTSRLYAALSDGGRGRDPGSVGE